MKRLMILSVLAVVFPVAIAHYEASQTEANRDLYLTQLRSEDVPATQIREDYELRNLLSAVAVMVWLLTAFAFYFNDVRSFYSPKKIGGNPLE